MQTVEELRQRLPTSAQVRIGPQAALVLDAGNVLLQVKQILVGKTVFGKTEPTTRYRKHLLPLCRIAALVSHQACSSLGGPQMLTFPCAMHEQKLELDGALRVSGAAEAQIVIDGLRVSNAGWRWRPLGDGERVRKIAQLVTELCGCGACKRHF